jgi:hypothetical protein
MVLRLFFKFSIVRVGDAVADDGDVPVCRACILAVNTSSSPIKIRLTEQTVFFFMYILSWLLS